MKLPSLDRSQLEKLPLHQKLQLLKITLCDPRPKMASMLRMCMKPAGAAARQAVGVPEHCATSPAGRLVPASPLQRMPSLSHVTRRPRSFDRLGGWRGLGAAVPVARGGNRAPTHTAAGRPAHARADTRGVCNARPSLTLLVRFRLGGVSVGVGPIRCSSPPRGDLGAPTPSLARQSTSQHPTFLSINHTGRSAPISLL